MFRDVLLYKVSWVLF